MSNEGIFIGDGYLGLEFLLLKVAPLHVVSAFASNGSEFNSTAV